MDGLGIPVECALSTVVPIFKEKVALGTAAAIVMKPLEHGMKVVEMVFEKRLHRTVTVDEMHFGFMPERGTIDAVYLDNDKIRDLC